MSNPRLMPYFMILCAGVIWGSTFSLALITTAGGAHPLGITTWQVGITAVIFIAICFAGKTPIFRRRHLKVYTIIAAIGVILPDILYYNAAPHLSAGILSITVSTVPLFTYAIMWAMRYEPLIFKRVLGIALGMIAIMLLVLPDQGLTSADANLWTLVVLVCAVCYAVENVYISEGISADLDIRELLCGSNIVATIVLIPVTLGLGVGEPPGWLVSSAGLAIIGISVSSAIAYMMFFYTIKRAGPVFASQCAYVVTISGVVWGIIIFAEQHTLWVWASVAVMMVGLALVTPNQNGDNSIAPVFSE